MGLIDFILNVAALLLWLNWRSVRLDPINRATPATLAGTLRRIEAPRFKRSYFLVALGILLLLRAVFYGVVGPATNWTPKLELFFVTLAFAAHIFFSVFLFSVLSFVRILIVFYFWLLVIAIINRQRADSDPLNKMLLSQLGQAARWPVFIQALAPVLVVAVLWIALHPVLIYANVLNRVHTYWILLGQAFIVGGALYFSLKLLLPALLLVHLVAMYIYLGKNPLWDFVSLTARNLLRPLQRWPLALGKVDFMPIVGIVIILLLLHIFPNFLLIFLEKKNLTVWPQ